MQDFIPKSFGKEKDCKVIFLNDKNLEILKGYKTEVTTTLSVLPDSYPRHHASVNLTITGLSNKAANKLYSELTALPAQDIMDNQAVEILKQKGFTFTEKKTK